MSHDRILGMMLLYICTASVLSVCPCSRSELCKPIESKHAKELVVFTSTPENKWKKWNWTEVTNVVLMGSLDKINQLYCFAHSRSVRVTLLVTVALSNFTKLSNISYRQETIKQWINTLLIYNLDGLNLDIEGPAFTQDIVHGISALTDETYKELKNINSNYLLTLDISYSPIMVNCYNGFCYDYVALSNSTDYMIVMDYDAAIERLIASANSPLHLIKESYDLYLINLSIDPMHLVMAVPWYGYEYTCTHFYNKTGEDLCVILTTRGKQISYSKICEAFSENIGGLKWNDDAASPYFTTKENNTFRQYQFDNVKSLNSKFQLALHLGLKGLGMFQSDYLDYSSALPTVMEKTSSMWNSITEHVAIMKAK